MDIENDEWNPAFTVSSGLGSINGVAKQIVILPSRLIDIL